MQNPAKKPACKLSGIIDRKRVDEYSLSSCTQLLQTFLEMLSPTWRHMEEYFCFAVLGEYTHHEFDDILADALNKRCTEIFECCIIKMSYLNKAASNLFLKSATIGE